MSAPRNPALVPLYLQHIAHMERLAEMSFAQFEAEISAFARKPNEQAIDGVVSAAYAGNIEAVAGVEAVANLARSVEIAVDSGVVGTVRAKLTYSSKDLEAAARRGVDAAARRVLWAAGRAHDPLAAAEILQPHKAAPMIEIDGGACISSANEAQIGLDHFFVWLAGSTGRTCLWSGTDRDEAIRAAKAFAATPIGDATVIDKTGGR